MAPSKKETKTAPTAGEIVLSPDIDITEIPSATRSSHKWDAVMTRAQALAKGKAFSFVVAGRSSVENLKKRLKENGYELSTITNRNDKGEATDVTVYVSNPK